MLRILMPLLTALILVISSLFSSEITDSDSLNFDTVNTVLGDVSYTETFGATPDEFTSEEIRIKTHLGYVINLLKKANTSTLDASQKENRTALIALLEGYKKAGVFPKNRHFETRRPVFIDKAGNLCAVGYLIAQTEGLETAQIINQEHKFDYIKDIEPKLIDGWLTENGITKKEAAMIQPMYGVYRETIKQNEIELEYTIGSSVLAGMQLGTTAYSILTDNTPSTIKKVSAFNSLLGMGSLTLGLINLDNTSTDIRYPNDPQICGVCYSRYETTYKNPARTKFSIANIVVGGLSAAFNGYRFFTTEKAEEQSKFNVSATQVYDPNSNTMAPGISMSVQF